MTATLASTNNPSWYNRPVAKQGIPSEGAINFEQRLSKVDRNKPPTPTCV